ncbi:MAG: diaminopimelate epimerase [Candidatus Poribacteria bacterium]|nr:diaminopimelate epimerase [Candidatus Poribacteria bacterium]
MAASIPFMKLSGAGNDFVIIDNRDLKVNVTKSFIEKTCARRLSVGADGMLLIEPPDDPNAADFKMRYYNADGSEAESCGNGARCISRFAYLNGIVGESMKFETLAGIYTAQVLGENVRVGMSDPVGARLDFPVVLKEGTFTASFADTGVPHVVYYLEDIENADIVGLGRQTRYHQDFAPKGTNANFAAILDEHSIRLRTYERGVEDETLACGTGSIAAAVLAAMQGKVSAPVSVFTQGGFELVIHFNLDNGAATNIELEGDARVVYHGELQPGAWDY